MEGVWEADDGPAGILCRHQGCLEVDLHVATPPEMQDRIPRTDIFNDESTRHDMSLERQEVKKREDRCMVYVRKMY